MRHCLCILAAMMLLGACTKEQNSGKPPLGAAKAPVRVATVERRSVPVALHTIGAVEAYSTIAVRAQVGGELLTDHFKEGDVVEQGQRLFSIDPRPYEVALKQAEANLDKAKAQAEQAKATLSKDRAQANNAQTELKRSETLLPKKMVSQEEHDQVQTNAQALQDAVLADEAAVQSAVESIRAAEAAIDDAKLRLEYCEIQSPIRGRTGSLQIHPGNLVKANDTTPLVTITQTEPIYVTFTLPEKHLSEVRKQMESGSLEVSAVLPGEENAPITGRLSFIDNTVNQATGTIRMKAVFENKDSRLWPGQFAEVRIQIAVLEKAVVAPSQAIQAGQMGAYAYVVKADLTVELRDVKTGESVDGMTVILEGLQPDETVVTDGQVRVKPGAAVSILSDAPREQTPGAEEAGKSNGDVK
ncbi:MAG TPA: efflux RND transporter periplasmic adaptor subunit [Candidatus Hydrogenedentes bacterium]|nr:efflux RND transporter periplasmic adaptor subunit [Candidatus Hydrogenedentota bacterium]